MIEKDNISIGQTVYIIEHWTNNIVRGTVSELLSDCVSIKRECFVDSNDNFIDDFCSIGWVQFENLYETAQSASEARESELLAKVEKYCKEITDVPSLLKFPLEHCLNGEEYTNYEAIKAYKIRAKQLLGIDLSEKEVNFCFERMIHNYDSLV